MKVAVAYLRVSTSEQGRSGLGLAAQRDSINRFISANGYSIGDIDWYTELASGKGADAISKRPVLRDAMQRARKLKGVLIVAKVDRLSRNTHFIAGLLQGKVVFRAADLGDETDNTFIRILAVFAEREREQIGVRTKDALKAAKERGTTLGNPTNLREVALRGAEANMRSADEFASTVMPVVNRIRGSGGAKTFRDVAEALNARGVPTARGGDWHPESVRRLIERADRTDASPAVTPVHRRLKPVQPSPATVPKRRFSRFRSILQ